MPPWHVGEVAIHNPWVPFNFVGYRDLERNGSTTVATEIAPPDSAKVGDLLVLCIAGRSQGNCTDPRMHTVYYGDVWGWPSGVWVGYWDGGAPISILQQAAGGAISQFSASLIAAFRGEEIGGIVRKQLRYDPNRLAVSEENGGIPAVPGKGSGAICVNWSYSGFGGAYGDYNWGRTPDYYRVITGSSAYNAIEIGRSDKKTLGPNLTPKQDTGDGWRNVVIGLR